MICKLSTYKISLRIPSVKQAALVIRGMGYLLEVSPSSWRACKSLDSPAWEGSLVICPITFGG